MKEGITKIYKSSRPGEIQIEVIKRCNLDDILLIDMISIPKSGDLSQPMNYRGISLS